MTTEDTNATSSPVYVPYATLTSALESLRTHGIPGTGKIDKSLWDTQSGAIQGQLILAFRFLGLIDGQNRVLPQLPPLVEASSEDRKPLLRKIIEDKYRSVMSLDLATISQGQLDEAIRNMGVSGSTLVRAVRFFVKACTEVGIPISKRVSEKSKTRPATNGAKKRRSAPAAKDPDETDEEPSSGRRVTSNWEEKLLEKFPQFDPDWPDELKAKWFAGFERLMGSKPAN